MSGVLSDYIAAALAHAAVTYLHEERVWYGTIPPLAGVWAEGADQAACARELREVLEGWLLVGLWQRAPIPVIDGHSLAVRRVSRRAWHH